ncbi:hypothetical protein PACTADRAFT_64087 [Pachysolen tannophilus NRRL Y-2460]|uniref:Thiamine transporter n=1 Tax=Pachysolen tannophilus NRRL Y-2460 TaxID=669874 RepID=A0A1E4U2L1_PACTA|nr:hypothetical protein PACTADRAFT_64087 [Pachysolen tannophilus NRRL Y-2460]
MSKIQSLQEKLRFLEVPHEGKPLTILRNPDLEPMPPNRRIWGFWSFFGYWAVPNITIWTWSTGSAMLSLGLNIQQTMGALTLGNVIICIYTCLNSGPGSKFHIGYTVCQRMIFGVYGSGLGIVIRIVLSIVFYGSQSWLGGVSIVVVLSSWSKSYMNMENTFPDSLNMTTRDFIGFLVFQIIQFFFYFMKPEKMNTWVNGSCFITLIAMMAIFGNCLARNGGPGPIWDQTVDMSAWTTGWMWLYSITIWYGALSPDVTNQSDFSRFASSKKKMYLGIVVSLMTSGTFVPFMGLVTASTTSQLFDDEYWLPTDICLQWMSDNYSSGVRAAAFFCGFAFASSQLTFNVLANGFAGGMDLSGICPRYINIFRGAIITALLSWCVQPWNFYNSSSVFINVMSSFGVVVTPIIAIIVADFHLVRKAKIPVSHLYTTDKDGTFYFTKGVNWRAICCFFAGVAPGIPGLIASVSDAEVKTNITDFFYNSTIFSFICPLILYYVVCLIFPVKNAGVMDKVDIFDAFTLDECSQLDMEPYGGSCEIEVIEGTSDGIKEKPSFEMNKKVDDRLEVTSV